MRRSLARAVHGTLVMPDPLVRCRAAPPLLLLAAVSVGCFSPVVTLKERSAIEQELTSAALRGGVESLDLSSIDRGRRYALRVSAPADGDLALIRARIESRLARAGIHLAPDSGDDAAPSLRVAVPFSSVDLESTLIGIPLIVPGFALALGDISIYRSNTLTGRARVELSVWVGGGAPPREVPASEASRYYQNFTVLTFIGPFRRSDLDEGPLPGEEP